MNEEQANRTTMGLKHSVLRRNSPYRSAFMARHFNSKPQNVLPMLQRENVGSFNWGFVAGKTNTYFPRSMPNLDELIPEDGSEPELWFHDILRKDGTPFDPVEIDTIKAVNSRR